MGAIKKALMALIFLSGLLLAAWYDGKTRSDLKWQAIIADADRAAEAKLADLTAKAMRNERQLRADIDGLKIKLKKEKSDAKSKNDAVLADIGSGALSLWAPINQGDRNANGTGTGIGFGKTRAKLDAAFAQSLYAIAADGDDAIRDLNCCIDAYDRVRESVNQ